MVSTNQSLVRNRHTIKGFILRTKITCYFVKRVNQCTQVPLYNCSEFFLI